MTRSIGGGWLDDELLELEDSLLELDDSLLELEDSLLELDDSLLELEDSLLELEDSLLELDDSLLELEDSLLELEDSLLELDDSLLELEDSLLELDDSLLELEDSLLEDLLEQDGSTSPWAALQLACSLPVVGPPWPWSPCPQGSSPAFRQGSESPLCVPRVSLLSLDDSLLEESPWPPPPESAGLAGAQADKSNDSMAVIAMRTKIICPQ